jgi:hypothetical protein
VTTVTTTPTLPIAGLNDPTLLARVGSELRATSRVRVIECECGRDIEIDGALQSMVLDLHEEQGHQGAVTCAWAACRHAATS